MKKSPLSPPDEFSISPLFTVLPRLGDATALYKFKNSLFARLEGVTEQREDASQDRSILKKLNAEEAMLKVVLAWLK